MRVVCDTNIIISSFLSPQGTPTKVIELWKNQVFDLALSEEILMEYKKALSYKHVQKLHHMTDAEISEVIEDFSRFAYFVKPKQKLTVIQDDPDDNKFLECAQEAQAAYIVSGDSDLLRLGQYQGIQIVTPAAFLALSTL